MSTTQTTPRFRPLTPKDMADYAEELKATQLAAQNPVIEDPATPDGTVPPAPATVQLTQAEYDALIEDAKYKQRFGDQTRHTNELLEKERKRIAELEQKLKTPAQRFATPEEVSKFEQEVTTTPVLKQLMDDLTEQKLQKWKEEQNKELEAQKALSKKQVEDVAKLSKVHPDWREFDTGASLHEIFTTWLVTQPIRIQEMADYTTTGDMDGAIAVLSMFKAQVQVKTGPNKKPSTTNPTQNTRAEIPQPKEGKFDMAKWDTDMDAAFKLGNKPLQNKLMAEFEKARAEGRL